jgi:hypothetical protein
MKCRTNLLYNLFDAMTAILKSMNLVLAFLLELAMLAAYAFWGFQIGNIMIVRIVLGIGIPLLVAVIWSLFMAPRSPKRLQGAAYLALKVVLFGLAIAALIVIGNRASGIVLAAVFVINTILLSVWQ